MSTHQDVTDDEILDFNYGSMGTTDPASRYERILNFRARLALNQLKDKVHGLMESVYRASQGWQDKSDELMRRYEQAAKAQTWLSIVIAFATFCAVPLTVWTVLTMKEANEIQREQLAVAKATTAKSNEMPTAVKPPADKLPGKPK